MFSRKQHKLTHRNTHRKERLNEGKRNPYRILIGRNIKKTKQTEQSGKEIG